MTKTAVITGASSGIGAATAKLFGKEGWTVYLGARRKERLEAVAAEIGSNARAVSLDVTEGESIKQFCSQIKNCNVLVNNAGGALGVESVAEADEDNWRQMYEMNVMGTMLMTRELLPSLIASGDGHVINICSVAAHVAYIGGAGYNAAKFGQRAMTEALRKELLGEPVRVTEIDPGAVETEFSLVRYDGDSSKADAVYQGITPLTAEDIAECIVWSASRPSHVNIDELKVMTRDQVGGGFAFNRKS